MCVHRASTKPEFSGDEVCLVNWEPKLIEYILISDDDSSLEISHRNSTSVIIFVLLHFGQN